MNVVSSLHMLDPGTQYTTTLNTVVRCNSNQLCYSHTMIEPLCHSFNNLGGGGVAANNTRFLTHNKLCRAHFAACYKKHQELSLQNWPAMLKPHCYVKMKTLYHIQVTLAIPSCRPVLRLLLDQTGSPSAPACVQRRHVPEETLICFPAASCCPA